MNQVIALPTPGAESNISLEQTLKARHSRRYFTLASLSVKEVSQILWAAYGLQKHAGVSDRTMGHTAPSAGGLYPLHIFLVAGNVDGLSAGIYEYLVSDHSLRMIHLKDIRPDICAASYYQEMLNDAPATLIYAAEFSKVTGRYGKRGVNRYVPMDIGHSAQNVYLQAEALGLGTCAIGAFDDNAVKNVLPLPDHLKPMYMMPVGRYLDK